MGKGNNSRTKEKKKPKKRAPKGGPREVHTAGQKAVTGPARRRPKIFSSVPVPSCGRATGLIRGRSERPRFTRPSLASHAALRSALSDSSFC